MAREWRRQQQGAYVGKDVGVERDNIAHRRTEVDTALQRNKSDGVRWCSQQQQAQTDEERLGQLRVICDVRRDHEIDAGEIARTLGSMDWRS